MDEFGISDEDYESLKAASTTIQTIMTKVIVNGIPNAGKEQLILIAKRREAEGTLLFLEAVGR